MKKILIALSMIILLSLTACTPTLEEHSWEKDFTISHITFEAKQFNSPEEELAAILNGEITSKYDYYVIKNITKSDYSVSLVFTIIPAESDPIEFKYFILGGIKSNELVTENILYITYEREMEKQGIDFSKGYEVKLERIDYEEKT